MATAPMSAFQYAVHFSPKEDRAERGPVQGPLASEKDGDEDQPRLPPSEDGRVDESVEGRVEHAGEAREDSGGDEGADLVAARAIAERPHAGLVDADSCQDASERGPHRAREQQIDRDQGGPDEEVRGPAVAEVEERLAEGGQAGALRDVEPIGSAQAGRFAEEVVEHLREGERDHHEVHAARAHAEESDHEGGHRGPREREGKGGERADEAGAVGEAGEEIGAETEEGGVGEAHDPGVSDQQIETHGKERSDHRLRRELHPEAIAGERHEGERDGEYGEGGADPSRSGHRWSAG